MSALQAYITAARAYEAAYREVADRCKAAYDDEEAHLYLIDSEIHRRAAEIMEAKQVADYRTADPALARHNPGCGVFEGKPCSLDCVDTSPPQKGI